MCLVFVCKVMYKASCVRKKKKKLECGWVCLFSLTNTQSHPHTKQASLESKDKNHIVELCLEDETVSERAHLKLKLWRKVQGSGVMLNLACCTSVNSLTCLLRRSCARGAATSSITTAKKEKADSRFLGKILPLQSHFQVASEALDLLSVNVGTDERDESLLFRKRLVCLHVSLDLDT